MPNYTIEVFWRPMFAGLRRPPDQMLRGWSKPEGLSSFLEAPLDISSDFASATDIEKSPIILISAPGAVGKSTLARQIASVTGAIYLDLALSDPVGGNSLSGGLVKSNVYQDWTANTAAVLIDGLDEARLRVTQEAFEAFLGDVAQASKGRKLPTVLFGRTGAIQDAWLALSDHDVEAPVLEIGYYGLEASIQFAEAHLRSEKPNSTHADSERKAIELLLARLRAQTESDGDRFAGYAPVLQAVANRVAHEGNPGALVAQIEKGAQPVTLRTVVSSILDRERGKLNRLPLVDGSLVEKLYSPDEQLDRLVARVYRLPPPDPIKMGAQDAQTYSTAIETWVAEHPFLSGNNASSAVFDAVICTHALRNTSAGESAIKRELAKGAAANPFLSEFYITKETNGDQVSLPAEHIGIVYSSLRARLSIGDTASLLVEGADDADEESALAAEVEITLARREMERPRLLNFTTEQVGSIKLGAYIEDVDITVPHSRVEIGPGPEAILVTPISIQCSNLAITADKIVVEGSLASKEASVYFEAQALDSTSFATVPVIRGSASFAVSWPSAQSYPWTSFATEPTPVSDPRIDEALRRFRRFIIAFRSHSKGSLARFKDKIEHARMTKGVGQAVLSLLMKENILSLDGNMYFLDADRLGKVTGATYADCMERRFTKETIDFVSKALA
ncbi:MAG: hypothetical protein A4S14_13320 [Proteobacteria bacterium SG_bin9]|nr:MAG: hypothetical protein A4S14_13320 [Proteobacteria bacterium SG_bin9]